MWLQNLHFQGRGHAFPHPCGWWCSEILHELCEYPWRGLLERKVIDNAAEGPPTSYQVCADWAGLQPLPALSRPVTSPPWKDWATAVCPEAQSRAPHASKMINLTEIVLETWALCPHHSRSGLIPVRDFLLGIISLLRQGHLVQLSLSGLTK